MLLAKPDETEKAVAEIGFPLVIKPVRSSGSRGFALAHNELELLAIPGLIEEFGPAVAQEFIPHGGSVGVSYLMNDGDLRAVFSHR